MNARYVALLVLGAALLQAAAGGAAGTQNERPDTIGRIGVLMPEAQARHEIAFRPFDLPRRIIASALLPPFHGEDTRTNRGIGFEYLDAAQRRFSFAQWPANGGSIDRFAPLAQLRTRCASARNFIRAEKPNGIVWTMPNGSIMTLQADGTGDWATLRNEWLHLVRRGACS